ncbi:MAG: hypothetical protein LBS43_02655, partial [Prevotellaceae bacterium]|nr:hypothetical protein [Prevotellaceae bacterium]
HITGVTGNTLILSGTSTTLTVNASPEVADPVFEWYDAAVGGTLFHTGPTYTTSQLTADTTFYISVTGSNLCAGDYRREVTVQIAPAIANDDVFSTLVNTPVTCDVLANDNFQAPCTDLQINIDPSTPANGTATAVEGKIVYTPAAGFYGVDEITYSFSCGAVESTSASLKVIVSKPLSQKYITCPNAVMWIGFKDIPDVTYNWYDVQTNGTPIETGDDSIQVTKDNSNLTQSWWVEVLYSGAVISVERIEVELEAGDCEIIDPTGCAVSTVLYIEDFGGNDIDDPLISSTPLPEGVTNYNFCSSSDFTCPGDNEYSIRKFRQGSGGWEFPDWLSFKDHTSADPDKGYYMLVNASYTPGLFYTTTISALCDNTNLYFSVWLGNVMATFGIKPKLRFVLEDAITHETLAIYSTGDLPNINSATWKMYGFRFTNHSNSVKVSIYNDAPGGGGNDLVLDDIEIRFCDPDIEIDIIGKGDTVVCEGSEFTFKSNYTDITDPPHERAYRWEYNATNNPNNPSDWIPIPGTEGMSTGGTSSTYTIDDVAKADSGYYRFVVANIEKIDEYNCRGMSDIIRLRVTELPTVPTPSAADICSGNNPVIRLASSVSGVTYKVYDDATAGTLVGSASGNGSAIDITLSTTPTATTTYYVEAESGAIPCRSSSRTPVDVTAQLTASSTPTDAVCHGGNGEITIDVSGGTSPYEYKLDGDDFEDISGSSVNFPVLAGTYTVVVKDANDCETTLTGIVINEPLLLTASPTTADAVCHGGNGEITIDVSGGTSPYRYNLDGGSFEDISGSSVNFSVSAGTYTVVVKDDNDCETTLTGIVINEPTLLTASPTPTDAVCHGGNGEITIDVSGGTSPYKYKLDGGSFEDISGSSVSFPVLAGTYTVVVKDDNDCETTLTGIVINEPATLPNYPDLRIRVCADAGHDVNLSKYIDTLDLPAGAVQWASSSGVPIHPTTGVITVDRLGSSHVYTFTYTVSNACVSDIKRKVYLEKLNPGRMRPLKDTVVICAEHAEAVQINQLFGIDARGTWSYMSQTPGDVNAYVKQSSTHYPGALIMNGKAIFLDSTIPYCNCHDGNAKKVVFTYTPADDSCLKGKFYTIVVILN